MFLLVQMLGINGRFCDSIAHFVVISSCFWFVPTFHRISHIMVFGSYSWLCLCSIVLHTSLFSIPVLNPHSIMLPGFQFLFFICAHTPLHFMFPSFWFLLLDCAHTPSHFARMGFQFLFLVCVYIPSCFVFHISWLLVHVFGLCPHSIAFCASWFWFLFLVCAHVPSHFVL